MPIQQKKYMVRWSYSCLYHGVSGGRDESYEVVTSSIDLIVEKLKQCITEGDLTAINTLVNAEFVHPEIADRKVESSRHNEIWRDEYPLPLPYTSSPWNHDLMDGFYLHSMEYQPYSVQKKLISYQADTIMYEIHNVRPVLEVLVLSPVFKDIYDVACQQKNGSLGTILANMSNKDFSGADLSVFDLGGADFSYSVLHKVHLGKIDEANFSHANLMTTVMSKELLYTAKTYEDAILPEGYWRFWSEETKQSILLKIEDLRRVADEYKNSDPTAYHQAMELARVLKETIEFPNAKYNEKFQRDFMEKLHSCDKHFAHAPLIQAVIGSIALFILSGGIGYIIAIGIRAYLTSNKQMLFFNQTSIEKNILETEKIITDYSQRCLQQ